jgi:hypothetical protein
MIQMALDITFELECLHSRKVIQGDVVIAFVKNRRIHLHNFVWHPLGVNIFFYCSGSD